MDEARIGNLGAAEIQCMQPLQLLEVRRDRIADPGVHEAEAFQVPESPSGVREPGIADRRREGQFLELGKSSRYLTPASVTAV